MKQVSEMDESELFMLIESDNELKKAWEAIVWSMGRNSLMQLFIDDIKYGRFVGLINNFRVKLMEKWG